MSDQWLVTEDIKQCAEHDNSRCLVIRPYNGGRGGEGEHVPSASLEAEIALPEDDITGGVLSAEYDGVCLFVYSGWDSKAMKAHSLVRKGSQESPFWEITFSIGDGRSTKTLDVGSVLRAADLGEAQLVSAADRVATKVQRREHAFWAYPGDSPIGQFEDLDSLITLIQSEFTADQDAKRRTEWGAWVEPCDEHPFINPYNFVYLGAEGPVMSAPPAQSLLDAERFSGVIEYKFEALSPLAIGGTAVEPIQPIELDGKPIIPGSSIAGVVRTFHEALTDSCLRMIDLEYVPVHRDPAAVPGGVWRMGVICGDGNSVRLCEPVKFNNTAYPAIWVEAQWLAGTQNSIKTGARFDFAQVDPDLNVKHQRVELKQGARARAPRLNPSGRWITLVSRALPKRVKFPGQEEHPYHLPFAELGDERLDISNAIAGYKKAAEGAQDVVDREKKKNANEQDNFNGSVPNIGTRQEVQRELVDGDVVWVELENGGVKRISRSVLWRSPGEGPVSDRIAGYAPCTKPDECCPSCRLFGMANTDKTDQKAGRHEARRGRVRFGMAHLSVNGKPEERSLVLSSPKPSSGQFYLESRCDGETAAEGKRPLRDWGSGADSSRARKIRGRKRYWPTFEALPTTQDSNDSVTSTRCVAPVGSTVTGKVYFEGLTNVELGALLASIDPNLLLATGMAVPKADVLPPVVGAGTQSEGDPQPLVHMIGGGKPYGLGAVRPRITCLEVWDLGRYKGCESAPTTYEEAAAPPNESEDPQVTHVKSEDPRVTHVKKFVEVASSNEQQGAQLPKHIAQLLAMSQFNRFPANIVKYPPSETRLLDFWQNSSGAYMKNEDDLRVFTTLPDAAEADPRIKRPWINGNEGEN